MKIILSKAQKKIFKITLYSFLIPLALILYGVYLTEFHNLSPIHGRIDLGQTEYQILNFSIDYTGKYRLKIKFDKSIDIYNDSLLDIGNMNVFNNSNNDTSFYYNWIITDIEGKLISCDTSKFQNYSVSFSQNSVSKNIGSFYIESKGDYYFKIQPSKPKPELTFTNPRIDSYIIDEFIRDYGFFIAFGFIPSILLTVLSIFTLLFSIIKKIKNA